MKLKTKTIADIRKYLPCYDPSRWIDEDWKGTALDILRMDHVPATDRVWCVCNWLDKKVERLFVVWCARRALKPIPNPDPRSVSACDVAERFANWKATVKELMVAGKSAWAAAAEAECAAEEAAEASWGTAEASLAAAETEWTAQVNHLVEMLQAAMTE